jgi:hypothetical protein
LGKIIHGTTISWQDNAVEESRRIVEALGCLAIAIVQAGVFIRETSCSLHDNHESYQRRKRDLLSHLPTHLSISETEFKSVRENNKVAIHYLAKR